jgi:hypothetical protein
MCAPAKLIAAPAATGGQATVIGDAKPRHLDYLVARVHGAACVF